MRRVSSVAGNRSRVEAVINSGKPSFFGGVLHAAGEIHGMAVRPVLEFPHASRVAHQGLAGIDADSQRQRAGGLVAPAGVQRGQLAEHRQAGPAGPRARGRAV